MTKIPTLYDKLKPNVKAKLNKSEPNTGIFTSYDDNDNSTTIIR